MKAKTVDVAELLLKHRVDLHALDSQKKTALMYARSEELVNLFVKNGADLEARDCNGYTALMIALMEDEDTKTAEFLVKLGADIRATDDLGRTVLDTAVWRNRVPVVEILVDKGVDLGRKDDRDRTVWHHLAMDTERRLERNGAPSEQILKILLGAKGANDVLDARDSKQRTSLHWAAGSGNLLVTKALLESDHVDVNATEHRCRTALHLALKSAAEVETQLAVLGQELEALNKDYTQKTTDDQLKHGSHLTTSGVVQGSNKNAEKAQHERSAEGIKRQLGKLRKQVENLERVKLNQAEILELLLQHKAIKLNAEADDGWTPVHTVCAFRVSMGALQRLLAHDVEINKLTQTSKTALHLACEAGNLDAVTALLGIPATVVDTKDNFGNSPLLGAAACGHRSIVELLAPWTKRHVDSVTKAAGDAAKKFRATVVDFRDYKRGKLPEKRSVFNVLYSDPASGEPEKVSTVCQPGGRTTFRWLHLPVNNVTWCRELLTKRFIEEGAGDVEGFKVLERSFLHQHRGQRVHSRYMRPMCRTVPRSAAVHKATVLSLPQNGAASGDNEGRPFDSHTQPVIMRTDTTTASTKSNIVSFAEDRRPPSVPRRSSTALSDGLWGLPIRSLTMESQSNTQSDAERLGDATRGIARDALADADSNVYLFAPYLHFETDARRREMQLALKQAEGAATGNGASAAAAKGYCP